MKIDCVGNEYEVIYIFKDGGIVIDPDKYNDINVAIRQIEGVKSTYYDEDNKKSQLQNILIKVINEKIINIPFNDDGMKELIGLKGVEID